MHERIPWDGSLPGAERHKRAPLSNVAHAEYQVYELKKLNELNIHARDEIARIEEFLRTCSDTLTPDKIAELTKDKEAHLQVLDRIERLMNEHLLTAPGASDEDDEPQKH